MSRQAFWRRILFWGAAVGVASFVAATVLWREDRAPSNAFPTATFVLSACAGFGACAYCFTRFVLCRELRYLLAAIAFSALSGGAVIQAIADLRSPYPVPISWIASSSWLIAAVLFAGSAHSDTVWRAATRRESVGQSVFAAVAVAAFPVALSPYALSSGLLDSLSSSPDRALACYVLDAAGGTVAVVLLLLALFGNCRRCLSSGDRMAGLISYFLIPCVLGLVFRAASMERFDQPFFVGEVLLAGAWLALATGAGLENAISHKEAMDRLEEMDTLRRVSWSLVGAGTVRELLNLFARTLVNELGVKCAVIYLAAPDEDVLEVAAVCGPEETVTPVGTRLSVVSPDFRPGFHSGHTAKAYTTRDVQIADDIYIDIEFISWRTVAVEDGCAASLPLVYQGKTTGILNLYFPDRRQFSSQRLRLLTTIAAAATPAIEHARAKETARVALDRAV